MSALKPLVLRNRQFGFLWIGQIFSQAGTRIYQIATLWWLLSQNPTHAGLAMGVFMILCALPAIIFIKKIGSTIDRVSSKKVLVVADGFAIVATLFLIVCLYLNVFVLAAVYIVGTWLALCQAFTDPTLNKAIPELTDKKDTEAGVAFIASTQSISNFGGAVAGALFIAHFGLKGAVILNAVSYVISIGANLALKPGLQNRVPEVEAVATQQPKADEDLFSGNPFLKKILIGFGCVNFFSVPLFIVMPVYTKMVFNLGAQWLALFEASLWLGLVVGTFSTALVKFESNIVRLGGYLLLICGVFLGLPSVVVNPLIYPVFLFVAAWAIGLNNVKFITLFQELVEDRMKGRFFAALGALVSFTFPASYFIFGLLIDHVSTTTLSLVQGSGVILLSFWFLAISTGKTYHPQERVRVS